MIGLLGGSFNPVHEGHVALARAALAELGLRRIIVMPTKNPPHKPHGLEFSEDDRLAMTRLAFESLPGVEVSDHEIRGEGYQYTFNTVSWLRGPEGPAPDGDIALILGADSFLQLQTWHRWQELLNVVTPVVGLRPGCDQTAVIDMAARLQKAGSPVILLKSPLPDISATAIRDAISTKIVDNDEALAALLPKGVIAYLKRTRGHVKADK